MDTEFTLPADLALEDALEELSSAEDFLEFFKVDYDPKAVHINRLHIMQRFHDYMEQGKDALAAIASDDQATAKAYRVLLAQAYQDFLESDALTEKVFKVFKMQEPQTTFVSAESLFEQ
jgi:nitrogenase-stabilizing/protective protein